MLHAFVISLVDAQERRRRIAALLQGQLEYEIMDATSGRDIVGQEKDFCPRGRYCPRAFRDLSFNEIACSISHKRAMERFLESGADHGLILEDDAHIAASDFPRIHALIAVLGNFDVLKLGGSSGNGFIFGKTIATTGDVAAIGVLKPSTGAQAYVVSRMGARKLIQRVLPISDPFDHYLRNLYQHGCPIVEASPWLAGFSVDNDISNIGGTRNSLRSSPSLTKNARSAAFRLRHNVMRRVFNLRRFGLSYVTESGFAHHPA